MSSTREIVDRVGGRFPFPDAAFDRLTRRRLRRQRNRRIGAGALGLVVSLLAIAAVARVFATDGIPADRPAPSPLAPSTPPSKTGEPTWSLKKRVYTVTVTDSTCSMEVPRRPVAARVLKFIVVNETDGWVTVDVGKLLRGHSFDELAAEIDSAIGDARPIDPVADRPASLQGSLMGDTEIHPRGYGPGSSVLVVFPHATRTWVGPQMAGTSTPGAWAAICYRESGAGGVRPIGVAGPAKVTAES
jgi:hypothetical protein